MYLERINEPNDIQKLNIDELEVLAEEIRSFLVEKVSKTGGHLASNLGVVELTIAMHMNYNLPKDKIIWDVGHQSYTHKLLTGRRSGFDELRKYGGMSGFPKRKESACDAFDTGHSSTSISAGLGYVCARDIQNEDYQVVSVIGDGSLTGGMAYEALNNAANLKSNFVIVLNDNKMSISKNVGGMSKYLDTLRTAPAYSDLKNAVEVAISSIPLKGDAMVERIKKTKSSIKQLFVPGMFFEDMGIKYLGPVDGHDIRALIRAFKDAKRVNGPVLLHVLTTKGKGYVPAEDDPSKFHGTGPYIIETGEALAKDGKDSNTSVFSKVMLDLGQKDEKLVTITAAMEDGTGLSALHPVFAVYSSFLQRGFDQMIHDVCLQNLPVVFAIDRAGLVGSDGETHQGVFDLSYLSMIPNMTVMAPKNKWELADMLRFAVKLGTPVALRYARGTAYEGFHEYREPILFGKSEMIYEEDSIALLCVGNMFETGANVYENLHAMGYHCSLVNARFVKPIDEELLTELSTKHKLIVTIEENVRAGGYGEKVQEFISVHRLPLHTLTIAIPDEYVEHGNVNVLRKEVKMDTDAITERIVAAFTQEEPKKDR